jgi:hypothetical protein
VANQKFRFPAPQTDPDFIKFAPPPSAAYIISVGRVVSPVRGDVKLSPSLKSIDVCSRYYDSTAKKKIPFTMRWIFEGSTKRWENFQVPPVGSIVQLGGHLVGRIDSEVMKEAVLLNMVDNVDVLLRGEGRGAGGQWGSPSSSSQLGKRESPWARQRQTPRTPTKRKLSHVVEPSDAGVGSSMVFSDSDFHIGETESGPTTRKGKGKAVQTPKA